MRLVQKAQELVRDGVSAGSVVVDATVGNGHDTLFLAQLVGDSGRVFGFDIQERAICQTQETLCRHGLDSRVTLFNCSHESMAQQIPVCWHGRIAAVMFNLGYLPGSDKHIVTRGQSSIKAIIASTGLLKSSGIMSIIAYPGHEGGEQETRLVVQFVNQLDPTQWQSSFIPSIGSSKGSIGPQLYCLKKR